MKQKKLFKSLLGILFLTLGITTVNDVKEVRAVEELIAKEDFESYAAGTNYQSTVTNDNWKIYYGNVSTSDKIAGSQSLAIRKYSGTGNYGYLEGLVDYSNVTKVTYQAKAATSNSAKLLLDTFYSIDSGSSWIQVDSSKTLTSSNAEYSFVVSETGQFEKVRIKFAISESSTSPSKKNAQLTIDDIAIYGNVVATEPIIRIASSTNSYVDVDSTLTFSSTIENADASTTVTYTSSNADVATMEGNVLTAKKVGKTTISASMTIDGTTYNSNNVDIIVWPKADSTLSIETANSLLSYLATSEKTPFKYYVVGTIKDITNTTYGNCVITDGTNDLTIYGLYDSTGKTKYSEMTNKPSVEDTCKLYGVLQNYSGSLRMYNAWVMEQTTLKKIYFAPTVELGFSYQYDQTISTGEVWSKVTDASTLQENDKIIIASDSKNAVAGEIGNEYMQLVENTFEGNTLTNPSNDNVILTLKGTSEAWQLETEDGQLLGSTAAKKLAWDSGTTTWTITIDDNGDATIQSTTDSYGRILHNVNSPRFTTYTSTPNVSMLLPQIYRLENKNITSYSYSNFDNYHLRFSAKVSESDVSRIVAEGQTSSDLTYGVLVTPKDYMSTSSYSSFEEAYEADNNIDFDNEFMAKNVETTLDDNGEFGVILNSIPNANVEICIVLYAKDSEGKMYFTEQKTVSIKSIVTAYYNQLDKLALTDVQVGAVKALYNSLTTNA